jgi:pimeloyl-ACP methyl ester carboxylesterase
MPLVVLTHGHPRHPTSAVRRAGGAVLASAARELAQLVPGGRLVMATQSSHDLQHEQPELVLDAIHDIVQAARAGDLVPH